MPQTCQSWAQFYFYMRKSALFIQVGSKCLSTYNVNYPPEPPGLRRLCHHPHLPAAQRTRPFSLPALHLIFWLGHKISLELLGLPVLKYFWGPSSHSWMACFLDLLQKLETRPEEEVGGIAPEIFTSIRGLWEGKRVPIVFMCLSCNPHTLR